MRDDENQIFDVVNKNREHDKPNAAEEAVGVDGTHDLNDATKVIDEAALAEDFEMQDDILAETAAQLLADNSADEGLNEAKQREVFENEFSENAAEVGLASEVETKKTKTKQNQKQKFSISDFFKKLHLGFFSFKNTSPEMKQFLKKWLIFYIIALALAVALLCFAIERHMARDHAAHTAYQNVLKINVIQGELEKLQNQSAESASSNQATQQALAAQLHQVQTALAGLSASNPGLMQQQLMQVQTVLKSTKTNLSEKIHLLQHSLDALKKQVMPKPTLPATALPFHVVYIDVWNGKAYAELTQKGDSAAVGYVGLYQRMGAWKVVSISAPLQTVDFVNAKGQMVHVQVKTF